MEVSGADFQEALLSYSELAPDPLNFPLKQFFDIIDTMGIFLSLKDKLTIRKSELLGDNDCCNIFSIS